MEKGAAHCTGARDTVFVETHRGAAAQSETSRKVQELARRLGDPKDGVQMCEKAI